MRRVIVSLVLAAVCSGGAAFAQDAFTVDALPLSASLPSARITAAYSAGSDELVVVGIEPSALYRIDTHSGTVLSNVKLRGNHELGIGARDSGGGFWTTESVRKNSGGADTIALWHVFRDGHTLHIPVPGGAIPFLSPIAANGNDVWFGRGPASIGRFDTRTRRFNAFRLKVDGPITVDENGALWIVHRDKLETMSVNGSTKSYLLPSVFQNPSAASAAAKRVWFADRTTARIAFLDVVTHTIKVCQIAGPARSAIVSLSSNANGVWFADRGAGRVGYVRDCDRVAIASPEIASASRIEADGLTSALVIDFNARHLLRVAIGG